MAAPEEIVQTAKEWHGGQHTMMYALASTGDLTPTRTDSLRSTLFLGLLREIDECLKYPDLTAKDIEKLEALQEWARRVYHDIRPTYEEENELALSLGWSLEKDFARHTALDAHWCKFRKDEFVVWKTRGGWRRARVEGDFWVDHSSHDTLKSALEVGACP